MVLPLSDMTGRGAPLLETNRFRHLRNVPVDRSGTSSRCTAQEKAQVKITMYAL